MPTNFCLIVIQNRLSCSKRILDECEKNVVYHLPVLSFERLVTEDGALTYLKVNVPSITPQCDIDMSMSYCEGIRDGVFGILGSD